MIFGHFFVIFLCNFWAFLCDTGCPACMYCSCELFPIPVTYVYIIYDATKAHQGNAQVNSLKLRLSFCEI